MDVAAKLNHTPSPLTVNIFRLKTHRRNYTRFLRAGKKRLHHLLIVLDIPNQGQPTRGHDACLLLPDMNGPISLAQSLAVAFKANFSLMASFIALRRACTLVPSPPSRSLLASSPLTLETVEYGDPVGGRAFPCRTDGIFETLLYPKLVHNGCSEFASRVSGGVAICFVVFRRSAESVFEASTTACAQLSSHGKSCSAS